MSNQVSVPSKELPVSTVAIQNNSQMLPKQNLHCYCGKTITGIKEIPAMEY
ncbi:MAG: hypothetical protein V7K62_17215 [Nostoc sp.]